MQAKTGVDEFTSVSFHSPRTGVDLQERLLCDVCLKCLAWFREVLPEYVEPKSTHLFEIFFFFAPMKGAKRDKKTRRCSRVCPFIRSRRATRAAISHLIRLQTQSDSCAQLHGNAADNGLVPRHMPAFVA